jgi:hypothetical protein
MDDFKRVKIDENTGEVREWGKEEWEQHVEGEKLINGDQ